MLRVGRKIGLKFKCKSAAKVRTKESRLFSLLQCGEFATCYEDTYLATMYFMERRR